MVHNPYERTAENKAKLSAACKERWRLDKLNGRISRHTEPMSDTNRNILSESKKQWHKENKQRHHEKMLEIWARPESEARRQKASKHARQLALSNARLRLPTKIELQLGYLLGDDFEYVGDGSRIIEGMNPDFIHKTLPLVFEAYGDYWHRGQDPAVRARRFHEAGYVCVVVWEHRIKEMYKQFLAEHAS